MFTRIIWNRLLALACAAVLGGILVVGLWPLTSHRRNDVAWIPNESGLRFGDYGTLLSANPFQAADFPHGTSCSLEIWSKPGDINDGNTMLAFYSPENLISFSVHQSLSDLLLQRQIRNPQGQVDEVHVYVDNVLRQGTASVITITSSPQGTSAYVDGTPIKRTPNFTFSTNVFAGQFVVANSPLANDSWSGDLYGLAFYDRELTEPEVLEHSESWMKNGRPAIPGAGEPAALYLFDERAGSIIHNHAGSAPDLLIPDHYLVMHSALLEAPWREYHPGWGYYSDLLVNVGGFIPFGFLFCAYFSSVRNLKRSMWMTILFGFAVSLTIETLQVFLPTRDSSMTDVINNTLGTILGAASFRWKFAQTILSRVGFPV